MRLSLGTVIFIVDSNALVGDACHWVVAPDGHGLVCLKPNRSQIGRVLGHAAGRGLDEQPLLLPDVPAVEPHVDDLVLAVSNVDYLARVGTRIELSRDRLDVMGDWDA